MFLGALVIIITGILIVNYFKDKKSEILPDLSTKENISKEHVVTRGETLWSIAEDNFGSGYNWVDIYKTNGLKSEKIEVGQKLTIPTVAAKEPSSTKKVEVVAKAEKAPAESYTVVKGDSLWKIAVNQYSNGYKWVAIAKANKLTNPNIIHAGNVLVLPK